MVSASRPRRPVDAFERIQRRELRLGQGETRVLVQTAHGEVSLPPRSHGAGPTLTAEAGQPLLVRLDDALVPKGNSKAEMVWRLGVDGATHTTVLGETPDVDGRLRLKPLELEIPPAAQGTVSMALRLTHKGEPYVDREWTLSVVPAQTASARFDADGGLSLERPIFAGDGIRLSADASDAQAIMVSFNGDQPQAYPLLGVAHTVAVPLDATTATLWLERAGRERVEHRLMVGEAKPDADPAWRASVLKDFPLLGMRDFVTVGPPTRRYNCIACSLGNRETWMWPGPAVRDFDVLFSHHGYRWLPTLDFRVSAGHEKAVLFARDGVPTHAAKQNGDGTWLSKIGHNALIRHQRLESLAGPLYGAPIRVYVRPARFNVPRMGR